MVRSLPLSLSPPMPCVHVGSTFVCMCCVYPFIFQRGGRGGVGGGQPFAATLPRVALAFIFNFRTIKRDDLNLSHHKLTANYTWQFPRHQMILFFFYFFIFCIWLLSLGGGPVSISIYMYISCVCNISCTHLQHHEIFTHTTSTPAK